MSEAVTPTCPHQYLTVHGGSGWICADCGVPVLSLMLPIPMPLIKRAMDVLTGAPNV